jgi:signal transduction histidine kinase/ActR/RegA family two-component response regulator
MLRYGLAMAIVFVATAMRFAVDPLIHDQIPYFIYIAGVVIATWFCGWGGGLVATGLSALVGNYFFVAPRYEFIPHGEDWIAMTLFAAVSLFLVAQVGRWSDAERELRIQHGELQTLHAETERMNRVKDEFLATLSHELRTPLNAVIGWAHLLADPRLEADKRQHAAEVILRNGQAQAALVQDMLDISRIITGKVTLHIAATDMSVVVMHAIETVGPAQRAKHIDLRYDLAEDAVVAGDHDRLRQIVWNLLSNAVKFTPKGGRVDVRTTIADSQFVLTVSDTGIGIESDYVPRMFQRFSQADSSTTREFGGLGVGLAIVRYLVELHGGTVTAESPGRGQGATFTVRLPIRAIVQPEQAPAHEDHPAVEQEPAPRLDRLRVLVVDDEPDARELVQAALARLGAEVRTAALASEAFESLGRWRPDVIVSDIGMPGEDGYSLIRRIRALSPAAGGRIPAVALTAYAQEADRVKAHAAGYQAHVAKPVTPNHLARVVADSAKAW